MALDARIYGMDDCGMAESISSAALGVPSEYSDSGQPTGEAGALGNKPDDPGAVAVRKVGMGSDSRACVEGNHGKNGCND